MNFFTTVLMGVVFYTPPVTSSADVKTPDLIKVAVVDSGLDLSDYRFRDKLCKTGHISFTGSLDDSRGHGTHVAGIIMKNAPSSGYCLMIIKYYDPSNSGRVNLNNLVKSMKYAVDHGANIINFSGGGPDYDKDERQIIASSPGVTFVVAAGNEGKNISKNAVNSYYPASYALPNMIIVGSLMHDGITRADTSNYGNIVTEWEVGHNVKSTLPSGTCWKSYLHDCQGYMSGTSQATATATGKLITRLIKRLYK